MVRPAFNAASKGAFGLVCLLLSSCVLWRGPVTSEGGHDWRCTTVATGQIEHTVQACEGSDAYRFQVAHDRTAWGKHEFRDRFRDLLYQYLKTTDYPLKALNAAPVDVWLEAPVFAPDAAMLVFVVHGGSGAFAVRLGMQPDLWQISDETLLLLGNKPYPTGEAWQAGVVLLEPREHLTQAGFESFLRRHLPLALASLEESWPRAKLRTRVFSENTVAAVYERALDAKHNMRRVAPIPAREPEAARQRVFGFLFAGGA